jgi:hypothetical protein
MSVSVFEIIAIGGPEELSKNSELKKTGCDAEAR